MMMKSAAAGHHAAAAFRLIILCLILLCSLCAATGSGSGSGSARGSIEELLARREEEIQRTQDLLIRDYKSLLQAQGELIAMQAEFRAMQANITTELENMQANITAQLKNVLHDAIALESDSRLIRAFFFYSCVAFLLHVITCAAQETFHARGHLFLGLCATMMVEAGLIKLKLGGYRTDDVDDYNTQLVWVLSKVLLLRSTFVAAAAVHVVHSIVTHRRG